MTWLSYETTPTGLEADRMRDAYRRLHPEIVEWWPAPNRGPPKFGAEWIRCDATDELGRFLFRAWKRPPQWPADVQVPRRRPNNG